MRHGETEAERGGKAGGVGWGGGGVGAAGGGGSMWEGRGTGLGGSDASKCKQQSGGSLATSLTSLLACFSLGRLWSCALGVHSGTASCVAGQSDAGSP